MYSQTKNELEEQLDDNVSFVQLILEEFARRDAGQPITDHHTRGVNEVDHQEVTNLSNKELTITLNTVLDTMALSALVYETRFRDSYYTNVIYNALSPLKGES